MTVERIERGQKYDHEKYGTVKVWDIHRRINAVEGDDLDEVLMIEFSVNTGGVGGENIVTGNNLKTQRLDVFRASVSEER